MSASNMTAGEFEELREALGLTQALLAHLLGVEDRTIRRWAAGERDIPIGVAMIMRLLVRHRIHPGDAYFLATGERLTGIASSQKRARRQRRPMGSFEAREKGNVK